MKVSIALAVYNGEKYLGQQLESYLNQTRLPDELVVGDDGSTDKSILMVKEFAEKAPFPVFLQVNEKNLGFIRNFDEIINRCTGDIIFLSDFDDVWMPSKIEKFVAEFEKDENIGLVFSDAEMVDENLNLLHSTLFERIFPPANQEKAKASGFVQILLERNVIGGATSAFRAKFREFFSPLPTHLSMIHDGWIGFILASFSEIRFLNEPLMKYRQHSRQETKVLYGNDKNNENASRQKICEEGISFYKKREQELTYLLEILNGFKGQLPENEFLKTAINSLQNLIDTSKQAGEHFNFRKNLSIHRLGRLYRVGKEVLTGRYHKFSNGFASAGKDLIYK
jgi:glycosyltransferase involved in cell wall biosynthesis